MTAATRNLGCIAVVVGHLKPYGGQRIALELAAALSQHHPVVLVTFEPTADEMAPKGVRHIRLSRRRRGALGLLGLSWQLRRSLQQQGVDAALSVMTYANLATLIATRLSRIRCVISEHTIVSVALPSGERHPKMMLSLMRLLYPRADAIAGVSNAVVADLEALGVRSRALKRVYNPVDRQGILAEISDRVPHPWLADPSIRTVVMVAALKSAKGHEEAIAAVTLLPPEWRLIAVGDGPLADHLRLMVQSNGLAQRVDFVGWQRDPRPWMKHASVVLLASRWEGFGLVAVEATILGTRVVTTNVGGLAEVAALVEATVSPDRTPQRIAQACLEAWRSPPPVGYLASEFRLELAVAEYLRLLSGE